VLTTGGLKPKDMAPFASRTYDVLAWFVVSPWSVMKAVCAPHGLDPLALSPEQVSFLLDAIAGHVRRVTDGENADSAKDAIRQLMKFDAAARH
jgi:hypothetical protein